LRGAEYEGYKDIGRLAYWGPYLADADLNVFSGDKLVGRAKYHAPAGLGSHGSVEAKIGALVDQMLPPSVAAK